MSYDLTKHVGNMFFFFASFTLFNSRMPMCILYIVLICIIVFVCFQLALLYNFTSGYSNIPSCRQDESKTSFLLQDGIFIYSRVFVQ